METPLRSAKSRAVESVPTLKAMMCALPAIALFTSPSATAPMPSCTIRMTTRSCSIFASSCLMARIEPETSAFTMSGSTVFPPSSITAATLASAAGLSASATIRSASFLFAAVLNGVPAGGSSLQPEMRTGWDGPADGMRASAKFSMKRTGAEAVPATTTEPVLRVPFLMMSVALMPCFGSCDDSRMNPSAGASGSAVSSARSAVRSTRSSNSGTPSPDLLETPA